MFPLSPTTTAAVTASATAAAPPEPPAGRIPPSPAAKPRGNPTLNLAPRRGARTRAGCPCQAPALRGRLRCRQHGGRSTGPRAPEMLANIRAARTIHGRCGAKARAANHCRITLLCRTRVTVAADRYQDFLPPAFVARLHACAPEPTAPRFPTSGITAAQDNMRRRAVAAALAPWQQAIAAARAADPNARVRPPRATPRRPTQQALLAALLAELRVPERAPAAPDTGLTKPYVPFPSDAGAPEPCVPFPPAGPAALAPMPAADPHGSAPAVPARCAHENARPEPRVPECAPTAPDTGAPKPYEPFPPAGSAASAITSARDPHPGARAAPRQRAHTNHPPEPFAPEGAPAPRQTAAPAPHVPVPVAAGPVLPPGLPDRTARRRWMHQQQRLHLVPPAATRP